MANDGNGLNEWATEIDGLGIWKEKRFLAKGAYSPREVSRLANGVGHAVEGGIEVRSDQLHGGDDHHGNGSG